MLQRLKKHLKALVLGAALVAASSAGFCAGWTVPDKGTPQNDNQAILFQEYLKVLMAGLQNTDVVLTGGAVTAQGSPDMTVAVAKVTVRTNNAFKVVTAANGTITTANATNPRIDIVVINSSGAIAVRAGTAAAAPKPPALTANDVALAAVYVPANDTTISSDQIVDLRVAPGPVTAIALAADATASSSTTPAEVTNLTIPVDVGTYTFKYTIRYQTAATTTGIKFDVNHSGTVTTFQFWYRWVDTSATASTAAADQDAVIAAGQVMGAMASRAKGTGGKGTTISVDTANSDMLMIIEGLMIVTVAGDLQLYQGSEVAASNATVKAGSSLVLTKTGG